jgi:DNA topoisomerase-1
MPSKTASPDVHNLYGNPELSASTAGLRYLPDSKPGISRKLKGKHFVYFDAKGNPISEPKILDRIKNLVIPPAWTEVWICTSPNGHLQATGRDTKGRKQYLYHPDWNQNRNQTKFGRMLAFGQKLPLIRETIEHDLRSQGLTRRKITAIALNLMDQSLIRIGNRYYANSNKSYGLTTLRDKHVKIDGSEIKFEFVGKKGVIHSITVNDKRLARLVKKCRDIPGYDLFQYFDETGNRQTLESGDVNTYLKEITETDFSAKDFRTWGGTVRMVASLEAMLREQPELAKDKLIKEAFKTVAKGLGNTPSVCSKYYVHPQVVALFNEDKLVNFLKKYDVEKSQNKYLSGNEELVLKMLKTLKQ